MADVTLGFKVSEELKAKAQEMIEASGLKSKEWIEHVIQLASMQGLKEGAPGFANDIAELELHTARINQLVANMVQRSAFEKEEAERKVEEVKSSRDEIIMGYQYELSELKEKLKVADAAVEAALKAQRKAEAAQTDLQNNLDDARSLVFEYREKNIALTKKLEHYDEMVNKVNELTKVNKQMESDAAAQKMQLEQQAKELTSAQEEIERLYVQLESQRTEMQKRHEEEVAQMAAAHQKEIQRLDDKRAEELEHLSEKKELEMEKAVLAARSELQEKYQAATEAHTKEVRELYAEIRRLELEAKRGGQNEK
jgi:myosin heavy subunit